MAEQLVSAHPSLRHVVVDGDPGPFTPWSALPAGDPPAIVSDTSSPALLLVSGGTTGAPKLIPRTHDDYVYNATASAELCRLTQDDAYLVALPAEADEDSDDELEEADEESFPASDPPASWSGAEES